MPTWNLPTQMVHDLPPQAAPHLAREVLSLLGITEVKVVRPRAIFRIERLLVSEHYALDSVAPAVVESFARLRAATTPPTTATPPLVPRGSGSSSPPPK